MLEDVQGALWSRDLIEENRRAKADLPALRRIVVAVDPAVSVSESSDETGIVVAGLGVDGHGYILEDASGKLSPIAWAQRGVSAYRKWGADRIVAEANQGGAMVETTVRTVDANISFKAVHASRGKVTRAEPIAALYEQGRVHHVGAFSELEDQLCTFAAGSMDSPDQLDAMVHGLTELMVDAVPFTGMLEHYRRMAQGYADEEVRPQDRVPGQRRWSRCRGRLTRKPAAGPGGNTAAIRTLACCWSIRWTRHTSSAPAFAGSSKRKGLPMRRRAFPTKLRRSPFRRRFRDGDGRRTVQAGSCAGLLPSGNANAFPLVERRRGDRRATKARRSLALARLLGGGWRPAPLVCSSRAPVEPP